MPKLVLFVVVLLAMCEGFVAGFGAVALVFFVTGHDSGIGGGLIAFGVGVLGALIGGWSAFRRLRSRRGPDRRSD